MLIFTRGLDDSIVIGDDVEITVLDIKGNTVKVGVSAPRNLSVHRSEVYIKVNNPKLSSVESSRKSS